MKKLFFILLTLFSFSNLNADYLLGNLERCASDYYYHYDITTSKYKLYYLNSRTQNWISTTASVGFIADGYVYDSANDICSLSPVPQKLGLKYEDYMFLLSLTGLLGGFTWLFGFSLILSRKG